ncbi:MAG: hypothetical protein GU346_06450 [Thermocrinis sp.]|jgi:cytochrome c556|nr:hypothetical protein [Thermocrinis sp.]
MADFTVYAWGYGDSMANALQGVAMLFGHDGTFYGVAKVAALFGFIAVLLGYFSARGMADPLRIVKFYVVFIGVVSIFFGITTTVQVQDKALNQTYVVQRVPYPVAYVLSFMTQVEDAIARQVDSAFGVGVQRCGSQNMGIFACSQIMAQATDMRVVDPYLYLNLTNFFQDCVFTNILDGSLDAHQLETSNNLYDLIFSNLHPARFTVLYGQGQCTDPCSAPCGGGCSMSCVDAGAYLRSALSQWVNTQGLNALSAAVGQTVLADLLGTVPSSIMMVSQTGTGFLMQAVLINQFKETYGSWAASQGMGLTEQGLFTKGQIEKATANRYLPLINGILHVLFASLVPVLVIFMLTPLMRGAIMLAFTFGLWMIVWKFAEAVVNGFFYSKLVGNFYNFAQQQGWDFNVLYAPVISSLLVDHISLGGSLYWLVPTVSFMIASLGGYAFHSFATGLGGIVQGTAHASAGDVARGSFNAGQVNYRNVSAGTTSLGNFSWGTTSFFTTSGLQENVGNITRQGNVVTLNKGSVGQAMGVMHKLDEPSRRTLSNAIAIAGGNGIVSMVYNEETGQLQSLSIRGGDGGFAVEYDGSGKLMIEKGGVKHGSVELDNSGRIKGFESSVQIGGLSLDYVRTKAKEISEIAQAYRQVGEAFKTIASKGIRAVDLKSLRDNLAKIVESNFASFLEAAKAWGVDKDIIKEIAKILGQKLNSEYRTLDGTQFTVGASGGVGVGTGGGKNEGGSFWPFRIGGGGSVGFEWIYTDQQVRAMSAQLSRDQKNALVDKFIESLQNKSGQKSSDSQAKRVEQSYTQGKDVSEEASKSKVYEVAESFEEKYEEMLTYADRLQASLKQDPLNYYVQQKYKEALAAGKSEGEAVRYAIEEVAKLRSNPEALEKWLNEFAKGQGIKSPDVDEKKLEGVPREVPNPEDIKKKGQELEKDVEKKIDDTQKQIEQRRNALKNYSPPKAKLFNLQAPKIDLSFNPNDPKFKLYEEYARRWFINRPSPVKRALEDALDTAARAPEVAKKVGGFVIDLGRKVFNTIETVEKAANEIDSKYGNIRYKP